MKEKNEAQPRPARTGKYWGFRIGACCGALLVLLLVDVALNLIGAVPPEDPLVFHAEKYIQGFTPFVDVGDGWLNIRPGWVKKNETYRITKGARAGRLFLHPGFRACQFRKKKTADTIRVFALGGSTTFGQWVGASNCFSGLLNRQLEERFPERNIEVINLGCPGLESRRVAVLCETVLELDPDLVLIYTGHNEMLMGEHSQPPERIAGTLHVRLLKHSSFAAWFNYGLSRYRHANHYEMVSEEAAALEVGQILSHDQQPENGRYRLLSQKYLKSVQRQYADHIRTISEAAKTSNIPILFILPATNVLLPPRQSAHANGFVDVKTFDRLLEQAEKAIEKTAFEEALKYVDRAIELSPDFAMARYIRGAALGCLGRPTEALSEFQQSVDLNVGADRMTSGLQRCLEDVLAETGDPLIDLRPLFQRHFSSSMAHRLFVDHCHPTPEGHRLIANAIMPAVLEQLKRQAF